jgi:hypothetical protein
MSYLDELQRPEWRIKRKEIIERDNCLCQSCFNSKLTDSNPLKFKSNLNRKDPWIWFHVISETIYHTFPIDLREMPINTRISLLTGMELIAYVKQENAMPGLIAIEKPNLFTIDDINEIEQLIINKQVELSHCHWLDRSLIERDLKSLKEDFYLKSNLSKQRDDSRWLLVPSLEVHHKKYISGLLAWQYPSELLITLCRSCHESIHTVGF